MTARTDLKKINAKLAELERDWCSLDEELQVVAREFDGRLKLIEDRQKAVDENVLSVLALIERMLKL